MPHTNTVSERTHGLLAWIGKGVSNFWHWLRGDTPAVDGDRTAKLPRAERKRRRKELIAQANQTKGR
jgi:hypothetical protein